MSEDDGAERARRPSKHVVVQRGNISPAVVVVWLDVVLLVALLGSSLGRAVIFLSGYGGPVGVALVLSLLGALLNAWVVSRREVTGYVTTAALQAVEWRIFAAFDHTSPLRPWRTSGNAFFASTTAIVVLELVWFAARGGVRSVPER
jgi:hypothetical protein